MNPLVGIQKGFRDVLSRASSSNSKFVDEGIYLTLQKNIPQKLRSKLEQILASIEKKSQMGIPAPKRLTKNQKNSIINLLKTINPIEQTRIAGFLIEAGLLSPQDLRMVLEKQNENLQRNLKILQFILSPGGQLAFWVLLGTTITLILGLFIYNYFQEMSAQERAEIFVDATSYCTSINRQGISKKYDVDVAELNTVLAALGDPTGGTRCLSAISVALTAKRLQASSGANLEAGITAE